MKDEHSPVELPRTVRDVGIVEPLAWIAPNSGRRIGILTPLTKSLERRSGAWPFSPTPLAYLALRPVLTTTIAGDRRRRHRRHSVPGHPQRALDRRLDVQHHTVVSTMDVVTNVIPVTDGRSHRGTQSIDRSAPPSESNEGATPDSRGDAIPPFVLANSPWSVREPRQWMDRTSGAERSSPSVSTTGASTPSGGQLPAEGRTTHVADRRGGSTASRRINVGRLRGGVLRDGKRTLRMRPSSVLSVAVGANSPTTITARANETAGAGENVVPTVLGSVNRSTVEPSSPSTIDPVERTPAAHGDERERSAPPLTFRHVRGETGTDTRDQPARSGSYSAERGDTSTTRRGVGAESGDRRTERGNTAATTTGLSLPSDEVDVDRLVDDLYSKLERKMRIERERRGLS